MIIWINTLRGLQVDENLKNAIWSFLYDDYPEVKALLLGGFYHLRNNRDEDDVVYPYGVFQAVGGPRERDSGHKWEKPIIQIDIYDDSDTTTAANSIMALIDSKFDDSEGTFTVTGQGVVNVERIGIIRPLSEDLGDTEHYRVMAEYQLDLQK